MWPFQCCLATLLRLLTAEAGIESLCDCVCGSRPESGERRLVTRSDCREAETLRHNRHAGVGSPGNIGGKPTSIYPVWSGDVGLYWGCCEGLKAESPLWWPLSGPPDWPWMTLWWFRVSGGLSLSVTLRGASLWRPSWRVTVTQCDSQRWWWRSLSNFKLFSSEEGEKMLFINEC